MTNTVELRHSYTNNGCVVVRGFIDSITIDTISKYFENQLRLKSWSIRPDSLSKQEAPSFFCMYADPMTEVLLEAVVPEIEAITGKEVHPTYSYSRIYMKGDELIPHTDRPSCEISVTVNVATTGKLWPIWMQAPGKDPISVELLPGDAVIYKGCEVVHWRDPMVDTEVNVQFMMHFVDKHGPNAEHKWDKRPALGYPLSSREK